MKKNIEVSIIIVSYNTKEFTLSCIKSIFDSKTKKSFEVIVVDNASSDSSILLLEKMGKKIRLIKNKENVGFAKANNQGIKLAEGDYIFLLNSDAEIKDYVLDRMVDFCMNHSDVGVVVPKLLNTDKSLQKSVYKLPTLGRAISEYWFNIKGSYGQYVPEVAVPIKVESAVMAAFMITPAGKKCVPFLNEKYFMYFEDLDYCREINRNGLSIYYLPNVLVTHHHGKSGSTLSDNSNQWRRLIPSSKIYHGVLIHYLIWFVMRTSQFLRHS